MAKQDLNLADIKPTFEPPRRALVSQVMPMKVELLQPRLAAGGCQSRDLADVCWPRGAPVGCAWRAIERIRPARSHIDILYGIVRDHFETFRALRDGEGLPRVVEQEFRDFVRCGCLAGGFVRFRCDGCGLDRLVALSCKGRGFCPRCGGRRMAERSVHLIDHVFPALDDSGDEPSAAPR